jgi:hypothetical protein
MYMKKKEVKIFVRINKNHTHPKKKYFISLYTVVSGQLYLDWNH